MIQVNSTLTDMGGSGADRDPACSGCHDAGALNEPWPTLKDGSRAVTSSVMSESVPRRLALLVPCHAQA